MDAQERSNAERNRQKLQEQIRQAEQSGSEKQKAQLDDLRKQMADLDKQLSQPDSQQQAQRQQGNPVGAGTTVSQPGVSRDQGGQAHKP